MCGGANWFWLGITSLYAKYPELLLTVICAPIGVFGEPVLAVPLPNAITFRYSFALLPGLVWSYKSFRQSFSGLLTRISKSPSLSESKRPTVFPRSPDEPMLELPAISLNVPSWLLL